MATNLEPRDSSDSLGRRSRKNRGVHSISDDFVYELPMTKSLANEVNIVSKGKTVIADVNDNGSVNKHGGARPKQNQEVSLVTVIQKLDTVLFELANLKTQLAQKADKADLDVLEARVHVLECRNENKSGVDGPRVDTKGDGSSLVQIVREEISERADIESRKLNLVVSGLDEPSASETTDNINTNDDDTQAVSMLFQTALNLKPYINKTIRLGRSTEGRPRLLCVTLNSAADRKEVLANAKKLREPQNQQFNQVYIRPDLTKKQCLQSKNLRTQLKRLREENPNRQYWIRQDKIIERVETD